MAEVRSVVDDATRATSSDAIRNLQAYIPGDRRRALATGIPIHNRIRGAALFVDISGFTPLTEVLVNELGPERGAEELTANLNRVPAAGGVSAVRTLPSSAAGRVIGFIEAR